MSQDVATAASAVERCEASDIVLANSERPQLFSATSAAVLSDLCGSNVPRLTAIGFPPIPAQTQSISQNRIPLHP